MILSALLLVLSYPPFDLGWLAWFSLLPWLYAIGQATPREAFRRSYFLGLLFFGATVGWVGYVTIPGVILLVAFLALYLGVWGWLANRLLQKNQRLAVFSLPAAWALLEYLRSILLSGFGWNLLAHTQWNWIPVIQMADITGATGVSFLIVFLNVAFYLALKRRAKYPTLHHLGMAVICLIAAVIYGQIRLHQMDATLRLLAQDPSQSFKIAVVQGNIPQRQKWDEAFQQAIWKRYEALDVEAGKPNPNLIVWPETAVPDYLDDPAVEERLSESARASGVPLLVGAPAGSPGESGELQHLFNSAFLFNAQGMLLGRYDKIHRVPFGEYLPLEPVLGWLRNFVLMGDFSPGHRFTVFHLPPTTKVPPFSVLICFEDLFPGLCRHFVQEGAQWLLVITNDAWFERSAASLQHLQASVFRAVENRVWVARAANTGWSGFVDPAGRRLRGTSLVPRFEPGVAAASLTDLPVRSIYSRKGDWLQLICLGLVGIPFFPSRKPI